MSRRPKTKREFTVGPKKRRAQRGRVWTGVGAGQKRREPADPGGGRNEGRAGANAEEEGTVDGGTNRAAPGVDRARGGLAGRSGQKVEGLEKALGVHSTGTSGDSRGA